MPESLGIALPTAAGCSEQRPEDPEWLRDGAEVAREGSVEGVASPSSYTPQGCSAWLLGCITYSDGGRFQEVAMALESALAGLLEAGHCSPAARCKACACGLGHF